MVLHKKSILKKTAQVGLTTILSRLFGLVREILMVRYLGASMISDAFRVAWQIPNMLRQVFAEGALSAATVPTFVGLVSKGERDQVSKLLTLSFLVFEGFILLLCIGVILKPAFVIHVCTPGFAGQQAVIAAELLRILMSFIFFISSSALLAGALQAVHHFWVPALSPVLLNIVFITALLLGVYGGMPVTYFCVCIVVGGCIQFLLHVVLYFKVGFKVTWFDERTKELFGTLFKKFLPSMVSGSVMQVSLLVDNYFASYLAPGSVSLLGIAQGFLRIPLGIFVSFATVLLTHFSRLSLYAPKRLSFYLLESVKLIFWLTLPAALWLSFFAHKIFYIFFYSSKFTLAQVIEGRLILTAFLLGLFFLAMNKVLLNFYYSLHQLWIPASITIVATTVNIIFCAWWVHMFHATGLAVATSVSAAFQTICFVAVLRNKFGFRLYYWSFLDFLYRYIFQLLVVGSLFYALYTVIEYGIVYWCFAYAHTLTHTLLFWAWVVPLSLAMFFALYRTKKIFKVRLYFLR